MEPSYWKQATMRQRIWDALWQRTGIKLEHVSRYGYVSDHRTVSSLAVVVCNLGFISSFSFGHCHNCDSCGSSVLSYCEGNPSTYQYIQNWWLPPRDVWKLWDLCMKAILKDLEQQNMLNLKQQLTWGFLSLAMLNVGVNTLRVN